MPAFTSSNDRICPEIFSVFATGVVAYIELKSAHNRVVLCTVICDFAIDVNNASVRCWFDISARRDYAARDDV